jgi:uncharacterized protein (DUF952 family)
MIYHMLPEREWRAVDPSVGYRAASLESEGFIHCTGEPDLLLRVANSFYADQPGHWLILAIDPDAVEAAIRWEPADGVLFPHIYGPLNVDAVMESFPFPRGNDRRFVLPERWEHERS